MVQCPVMRKTFFLFLLGMIVLSAQAFCQSGRENELGWYEENRIERAVDSFVQSHKHRLGPFRFQPRLSIRGGFDSNTVFGNQKSNLEDDFFVSVVPGISGGLRFGSRAYFKILQDYDFIYYFKNEQRRDIFGTTLAQFVTGTPKVLVTIEGGYSRRKDQVNQEIDEPIEHKLIDGNVIVEYSISPKIDFRHIFGVQDTIFIETEATQNAGLQLFDRRTYSFLTGAGYLLKRTLRLRGDVDFHRSETLDTNQVTNTVQVIGGIDMRRERLGAGFEAGIGSSKPENAASRHNFLLEGRVDYLLTRRMTVGGYARRRYDFSFLSDVTTTVVSEGGVHFNTSLATRLSLSGDYRFGRNDYGDQIIAGVVVDHDTFQQANLSLGIQTVKYLWLRPGIRYINRNTAIPGLDKSDFFWFIGLGFGYSFNL